MFGESEMELDSITNFIKDSPTAITDAERKVISGRPGDSTGKVAGDRFRRGRIQNIPRARNGGITKPTKHSASYVTNGWKFINKTGNSFGELKRRNVVPTIRTDPTESAAAAGTDQIDKENTNKDGDNSSFHGRADQRVRPMSRERLMDLMKEMETNVKSQKLLCDFEQLRL